jgi:hypothetical protein
MCGAIRMCVYCSVLAFLFASVGVTEGCTYEQVA